MQAQSAETRGQRRGVAVLPLARRASYRRALAILKGLKRPFVVAGTFGLSLHVGRLQGGDLEIYLGASDAPAALLALADAGFGVGKESGEPRARVVYGDALIILAWGLPRPLGGPPDEIWFTHAHRVELVDLKVPVAPIEELLWVHMATLGGDIGNDRISEEVLLGTGEEFDWDRLLLRVAGLELLFIARLFLFIHRYGERARARIPPRVLRELMARAHLATALLEDDHAAGSGEPSDRPVAGDDV